MHINVTVSSVENRLHAVYLDAKNAGACFPIEVRIQVHTCDENDYTIHYGDPDYDIGRSGYWSRGTLDHDVIIRDLAETLIHQVNTKYSRDLEIIASYEETSERPHKEYYSQFVTNDVCNLVLHTFGLEALLASPSEAFNDIPLARWEALVKLLPRSVAVDLDGVGDWLTLGSGVCVLKEAARQIVEKHK